MWQSAGYTDGVGASAQFDYPTGIAASSDGGFVVCDQSNHRLRKINLDGTVTTLAGGDRGYADGVGVSFLRVALLAKPGTCACEGVRWGDSNRLFVLYLLFIALLLLDVLMPKIFWEGCREV